MAMERTKVKKYCWLEIKPDGTIQGQAYEAGKVLAIKVHNRPGVVRIEIAEKQEGQILLLRSA